MAIKKHIEHLNVHKLNIVITASFFIALEAAFLAYINSSFLEQYIALKNLGYIYVFANIITIILILKLNNWVAKYGRYKIFFLFFLVHLLSLVGLAIGASKILVLSFFVIYNITLFITYIGIDVFTEEYSCDEQSGCIKGKQLTVKNVAWVVGPLISGYLLSAYGFSVVFFVSAVTTFVGFVVFSKLKEKHAHIIKDEKISEMIQKVRANKNVLNIAISALWLQVFFSIMVIYMPLYLISLGMDWSKLGLVFTVMLMAFLIFQYPAGWLADNKYGEKEMLMIGFIIAGTTTCAIFFINSISIWVWMIALFINRIGACLIEVMNESYFFKQIDGRDVDLIDFFRLTRSVGYVFGLTTASIILIFFQMQYLFMYLGIFMLLGLFFAGRIKDTR